MGQLNLYYKAFKEYRKYTLNDKNCIKQRANITRHKSDEDILETIRNSCIIDEEWVKRIEEGLPYVEQAIAEERQFIKNEGEVLEIEKVKRVSKESVEHLARHSELLTHVPENPEDDIIPNKIYMVERLSDYAVYENRFLYMLLCYMRDFIQIRLKKMQELGNLYVAKLYFKREIQTPGGVLNFEGKLDEVNKKDPFAVFDKEFTEKMNRIESSLHVVVSLLAKPLMVMVAKTPMLKPPITKTNVLKMNIKFKNALALYEYLVAYQGPGYEIKENKTKISPFTEELADEISELVNISSFLTYEYGNSLNEKLKIEYEQEEREELEKADKALLKKLEALKQKFAKGKAKPEEYINSLEEILDKLKGENEELKENKKDFLILQEKHEDLKTERIELGKKLFETEKESLAKDAKMEEMQTKHLKEVANLEEKRLSDLKTQKDKLTSEFDDNLKKKETEFLIQLKESEDQANDKFNALKDDYDNLYSKHYVTSAKLHAIQGTEGAEEDFSKEENFEELEKEFLAFYSLFAEKWKNAKKHIRQELLWNKFKRLKEKIEKDKV